MNKFKSDVLKYRSKNSDLSKEKLKTLTEENTIGLFVSCPHWYPNIDMNWFVKHYMSSSFREKCSKYRVDTCCMEIDKSVWQVGLNDYLVNGNYRKSKVKYDSKFLSFAGKVYNELSFKHPNEGAMIVYLLDLNKLKDAYDSGKDYSLLIDRFEHIIRRTPGEKIVWRITRNTKQPKSINEELISTFSNYVCCSSLSRQQKLDVIAMLCLSNEECVKGSDDAESDSIENNKVFRSQA